MIPIIGKSHRVLVAWPTIIIECQCDAKQVIVMMNPDVQIECPTCHNVYQILDRMELRVGQVLPRHAVGVQ